MRICLPCHAEYVSDVERCPDCGSRTMTPEEYAAWQRLRDELTSEDFVPIHVFDGPVDQAIIIEMLDEVAIPHIVRGQGMDPLHTAFTAQKGWGVLMVLPEDVERAREVVRRYESAVVVEEGAEEPS